MTTADAMTATEPRASFTTSRNAAFMFMLSLCCPARMMIEPTLAARPRMPKNSSSPLSATCSADPPNSRIPASISAYNPTNSRIIAPASAVSTSRRAQPQVRELLGFRRISTAVTVDAISTDMSVSICPASTSNASDPVMMAPTISATNTVPVKVSVIISRRWCALLPRVTSFTVPCVCGIVYLSFCLLCETVSYNHFQ